MHSDGLKTTWNLEQYPGIWSKHPALIAGVLYRDFHPGSRRRNVLVAKKPCGNGLDEIQARNDGDPERARRGVGAPARRTVAAALKFDVQAQTRLATAVSEIARNAFQYAGDGWIDI